MASLLWSRYTVIVGNNIVLFVSVLFSLPAPHKNITRSRPVSISDTIISWPQSLFHTAAAMKLPKHTHRRYRSKPNLRSCWPSPINDGRSLLCQLALFLSSTDSLFFFVSSPHRCIHLNKLTLRLIEKWKKMLLGQKCIVVVTNKQKKNTIHRNKRKHF